MWCVNTALDVSLTGALLQPRALLHRVPAELAAEVVLPELGKPDVPPVVLQRPADEVTIEPCGDGTGRCHQSLTGAGADSITDRSGTSQEHAVCVGTR